MQPLLRRTYATHAGKYHRRKPSKPPRSPSETQYRFDRAMYRKEMREIEHENHQAVREERRRRREDYDLGPLRPWREHDHKYGTFARVRLAEWPKKPERDRIRDYFVAEGDRACVVKGGPHVLGKIGVIKRVDRERDTVLIEGVNILALRSPEVPGRKDKLHVLSEEVPVPVEDVRLVYPMQDPTTGEYRDCILTHLEKRNTRLNPFRSFDVKQQRVFDRYLMPHNLRIPWPAENEPDAANEDADTLRAQVEQTTFLPTLLRPPMPEGVLGELRSEDKIFDGRVRAAYDVEHVERVRAEKAEREALAEIKTELVPQGARNMARKGSSAGGTFMSSGELPQFDEETLRVIGEHMMAARAKKEAEAGGNAVPATPSHAASV